MNRFHMVAALWLLVASYVALPVTVAAQPGTASVVVPATRSVTPSFGKKVSFSILQDYPKGEDLEQVRQDFQLMKELGIATWRGSFSWIDYEPRKGKLDLVWLRHFLDLALQEGITLRPYLAYTPQWAARGGTDDDVWNDPPKRLKDWQDFVSHMVKETKMYRNIASWEIYNEENVKQWWDGKAADYNDVLRVGAVAVKSAIPAAQVIFGGMVYPDDDWIRQACSTHANERSFDVIPFHAYPETWTPRDITVENYLDQGRPGFFRKEFIRTVDEACAAQPVWINEAGFATAPGKTEMDQANWWARAMATFLADPRVEHLGIYQVRDRKKTETVIGEPENYHLGLLRADRSPKQAFKLLKQLLPLLNTGYLTVADGELGREVIGGKEGNLHRHLFIRPDGGQVLFVWDKTGNPTLRLRARPGATATEYRLDGSSVPYGKFDGRHLQDVQLAPGTVRIFLISP